MSLQKIILWGFVLTASITLISYYTIKPKVPFIAAQSYYVYLPYNIGWIENKQLLARTIRVEQFITQRRALLTSRISKYRNMNQSRIPENEPTENDYDYWEFINPSGPDEGYANDPYINLSSKILNIQRKPPHWSYSTRNVLSNKSSAITPSIVTVGYGSPFTTLCTQYTGSDHNYVLSNGNTAMTNNIYPEGLVRDFPNIISSDGIVYNILLLGICARFLKCCITSPILYTIYIIRKKCPLCHYDLRGSGVDVGCPECGWNREVEE